jgi:hypothetical protein
MRRLVLAVTVPLLFAVALFAGKNLADYPLQIQVVESHWNRRYGTVDGWGRGDVRDGDSIRGFDFTYTSGEPFHRTVGDTHYLAKWKKQGLKMELLVGEIGSPDKYVSFDLKTTMRDDVYVPGPNGAIAVSQQEFKEMEKETEKETQKETQKETEKEHPQ